MKTVAVLGDGIFGTAIACLLVDAGFNVNLWCHNANVAEAIAQNNINEQYLPGVVLSNAITPMTDIAQALTGVTWVFEVVPVKHLREVLIKCSEHYRDDMTWVILSKGIEQETLMLPSHIIDDVFGVEVRKAVLAGPSFAHELAGKKQTAMVIASDNENVARELQNMIKVPYLITTLSDDMLGVQLGGALKNVITLGVGMLDGAGFGDNIKALFFTQGLHEIAALANVIGALPETIFGLSGIGDLALSSFGGASRNLSVGKRLGAGHKLETIV